MKTTKGNGKKIAVAVLIIGAVTLAAMAVRFIHHRMAYAVTDAVFVASDSLTTVEFDRVEGRLITMTKREGEPVAKGELLATIDDTPYRLEEDRLTALLSGAKEELAAKQLALGRLRRDLTLNEQIAASRIDQLTGKQGALEAKGAALEAEVAQLDRDRNRFAALAEAKAVASHRAEDVATRLTARRQEQRAVQAEAAAVRAELTGARLNSQLAKSQNSRIAESEREIQADEEKIKGLAAELDRAREDRAACRLLSPIAGRVAKRYASPGAVVSAKRAIYSLADPKDLYLLALLEENKLNGVSGGDAATIRIDAFPDLTFRGTVDEILPASAATFALAPRDLSAGEFTKVAQRIPIRIRITAGDTARLRVGLGGEVEIKRREDGKR